MLRQIKPRLGRSNVVLNSFGSCVSDTSKEFSRTPEVPVSEIVSEPGMLLHQTKGTITFKQLQCFADAHCCGKFNKEMDMVSSNMQLIDFTPFPASNLPDKEFTIHLQPIKLEGVHCVFNFPDKMESILSEAMLPKFQIHFLSPESAGDKAHANSCFISGGLESRPSDSNHLTELNLEDGDSSQNLKVWVSSP